MDPLIVTILLRSAERLLVVAAGAVSVYLGYRLFLAMPSRERGEGKLELPGGISIYLSRVGPGVFFSLFGAVILALSFHYAVSFNEPAGLPATAAAPRAAAETPSRPPLTEAATRGWSGAAPVTAPRTEAASEAERIAALVAVERLNKVPAALASDVDPWVRDDIGRAVRIAKLRLMETVWDEDSWGPLTDFRSWIDDGEPAPVPDTIREAVGHYQAGVAANP